MIICLEQIRYAKCLNFIFENDENSNKSGVYIYANLLKFNFKKFSKNNLFDVVLIDPPWKLPKSPSRGVFSVY